MYSDFVNGDPIVIYLIALFVLYQGYKHEGIKGLFRALAALIILYITLVFIVASSVTIFALLMKYAGPLVLGLAIWAFLWQK